MPGEASSVVTCIDGHQMARQGRAGAALAIAALGSFFAGCVGTLTHRGLRAAAGRMLAQKFSSPDYFSLMVLGLIVGGRAGARLGDQGDRHDHRRPAVRPRRHRRQHRRCALHLRHLASCPTASTFCRWSSAVRHRRDHPQSRTAAAARRADRRRIRDLWPTREDFRAAWPRGPARHRPRLAARHPAGRRRRAGVVRELHPREEDRARTRRASARARSRASPGRNPPTTRRRRPRSFRCSRSAFRPTR